jgi:uncharacterized paraquat-inducible protein A
MKDEDIETFIGETTKVIQMIALEQMKIQTLLYSLMEATGHLQKIPCPSCEEQVLRPDLPNVQQNDNCPACDSPLFEGTQTTFEDWDNGAGADESE